MNEFSSGTGQPASSQEGTLQQGKTAAREVAGTARERTAQVADEARAQTRRAVDELRDRVRGQSEHQSHRAAQSLRQWSEDLSSMQDQAKPDSPVSSVVRQAADQGRRAADYLDQNGLAGVVGEVQSFARRRPGTFLAGALAAGFLVGRIFKASGDDSGTTSRPTGPGKAPEPYAPPRPPEATTMGDPLDRQATRPVPPVAPRPEPRSYGPGSDLP